MRDQARSEATSPAQTLNALKPRAALALVKNLPGNGWPYIKCCSWAPPLAAAA
jgi:hypothetical protein